MLNLEIIENAKKEIESIVKDNRISKTIKLKVTVFNALYNSITNSEKMSEDELNEKLEQITAKYNEIKDAYSFEVNVMLPDIKDAEQLLDYVAQNYSNDSNLTPLVNELISEKMLMQESGSDDRYVHFNNMMKVYARIADLINEKEEQMEVYTTVAGIDIILKKPEAYTPTITASAKLANVLYGVCENTDIVTRHQMVELSKQAMNDLEEIVGEDADKLYFGSNKEQIIKLLECDLVNVDFAKAYADLIIINEYGQMDGLSDLIKAFSILKNDRLKEEEIEKGEEMKKVNLEDVSVEENVNEKVGGDTVKEQTKQKEKKSKKDKKSKKTKDKKKKSKKTKDNNDNKSCCSLTTKVIIGVGLVAAGVATYQYLNGDFEIE